jgi:uncharacterized protein YdeI (YjbR/CyaY-like superfamily)
MKPTDVRYFDSPVAFRAWLEAHRDSAGPTWVAVAKKGATHHVLPYAAVLDTLLCLGWIDGVVGRVDEQHYALRASRRRPGSNWSAVNVQRVAELSAAGLMHPAGLAAFESRDKAVSEETRAELAPADRAVFEANAAAWAFFQAQPPGYRRQASWYVISARTPATRQRRLARLVELCAAGRRLPGFS